MQQKLIAVTRNYIATHAIDDKQPAAPTPQLPNTKCNTTCGVNARAAAPGEGLDAAGGGVLQMGPFAPQQLLRAQRVLPPQVREHLGLRMGIVR